MTQNVVVASLPTDGGAPETEVEITDAMLSAGMAVFCAFDSRYETDADCVEDIFRAMWAAKANPD